MKSRLGTLLGLAAMAPPSSRICFQIDSGITSAGTIRLIWFNDTDSRGAIPNPCMISVMRSACSLRRWKPSRLRGIGSSSNTRLPGPACPKIPVIFRTCPEKVERLCSMLCSSPMSTRML